jgi:hypothetical protein
MDGAGTQVDLRRGVGEPEANKVELAGSERMERVGDRGAVWQTSVTAD